MTNDNYKKKYYCCSMKMNYEIEIDMKNEDNNLQSIFQSKTVNKSLKCFHSSFKTRVTIHETPP